MVCWISEIDAHPSSVTFLISTHSHCSLPQDVWARPHIRWDCISAVRSLIWLHLRHRIDSCSSTSAKFGSYIYVAVLGKYPLSRQNISISHSNCSSGGLRSYLVFSCWNQKHLEKKIWTWNNPLRLDQIWNHPLYVLPGFRSSVHHEKLNCKYRSKIRPFRI